MVRTTSFAIANYCVPCRCHCRHCLLDSRHAATGVEYERAERLAARLMAETQGLSTMFYCGYCMDLPDIARYVRFTGTNFLQCNGMGVKTEEEAEKWMRAAFDAGVRTVDMTFYGLEEAHDAFAGRKGDFAYLLRLMRAAQKAGIDVVSTVALTRTNMAQMEELFSVLDSRGAKRKLVFLSHAKGRGIEMTGERLTDTEFAQLPEAVRESFSSLPHLTEAEWIEKCENGVFPRTTGRNVTLVLTPENIGRIENMHAEEIIAEIEKMDDDFYDKMPAPQETAKLVGKRENRQIYRFRDLYLEWQKRYMAQTGLKIYDMNDERHSFSVRMYAEREIAK